MQERARKCRFPANPRCETMCVYVFGTLDFGFLTTPRVFEGFRHARATKRAGALRPTFARDS
eukprot:3534675-Pyramimonas_sp.AAC.1